MSEAPVKPGYGRILTFALGGTRSSLGMPSFKDLLSVDQVRAIQAYVLSRAREGANPPAK